MVGKTKPIKPRDQLRFRIICDYMGCLCCALDERSAGYEEIALTTIEHVTEHGRRLPDEHQATIGLCPWHHQGIPWNTMTKKKMLLILGPSLADGRKPFEAHYGDEVNVLLPLQDELIIWFADEPWQEYTMPERIRQRIRSKWIEIRNQS